MKSNALNPKYLPFLLTGYITSIFCSLVLFTKQVQIGHYILNAGTIIYPITYFIAGLIAEIYGYAQSRKATWSAIICMNLFAITTSIMVHLPSPVEHDNNAKYLLVIFGYNWRFALAATIAFIMSEFLMTYCISIWKVLLRGRNYFMRFVGSVAVAEILNTILVFSIALFGILSSKEIMELIITAYLFKIIAAYFLAFPAVLIANFMKKAEGFDVIDYNVDYNPFKIS